MLVTMECTQRTFRPVEPVGVRWLDREREYPLAQVFWPQDVPLSREDWDDAHIHGYGYCGVVEEGRIASIGAVWTYAPDKWEVAAVRTRQDRRCRGLATRVVSFATGHILASGRIATCTAEPGNVAMIRVAEGVGFRRTQSGP